MPSNVFAAAAAAVLSGAAASALLSPAAAAGNTAGFPERPIRKTIRGLPSFTTVKGGAYFFLPGLRALRFLARAS